MQDAHQHYLCGFPALTVFHNQGSCAMAASNLGRSNLSTLACSPKIVSYLLCFFAMSLTKLTAVNT